MITNSGQSAYPLTSTERYGTPAIAFHWISVVLVVAVGVLGLLHDSWPKKTQAFWINIHALVGLTVWVLVLARFAWRCRNAPPPLPADVGNLVRRLSGLVHGSLYALLFVIPIIGIVTFIWHGRAFDFGLFRLNFGVRSNKAIFHPTEDIHGYLAYALFTLVGIHVLAALWHQFVRHDGVLRRMWPGSAGRHVAGSDPG
jgi:cytochrome b561